mgnify:FL=1
MENKIEFVQELDKVLRIAKPHLTVHYALGQDIELKTGEEIYYKQSKGISPYHNGEEYLVVECEGGHQYVINITANSLAAIAEALFKFIVCK